MATDRGKGSAEAMREEARAREAPYVLPRAPLADAETRQRLQDRALRVLSRGVVHKLNNALAVFSSHAQLAEAGTPTGSASRDARALQNSVERARRVLEVLDRVTRADGEVTADGRVVIPLDAEPVCLGPLVRGLGEVLLCERSGQRYPVEVRAEPRVHAAVSAQVLLVTLILVVDHLAEKAPVPLPGSVVLEVHGSDGRPKISVGFQLEAGHLPFRLPAKPLPEEVRGLAAAHDMMITASEDEPVYRIEVPRAAGA